MKVTIALFFALVLSAQTRSVTLTWTDTINPPETTYKVERADGICAGTLAFSVIASGLPTKGFNDPAVGAGQKCYQVRASLGGIDSPPSPQAQATIGPAAPSRLDLVIR